MENKFFVNYKCLKTFDEGENGDIRSICDHKLFGPYKNYMTAENLITGKIIPEIKKRYPNVKVNKELEFELNDKKIEWNIHVTKFEDKLEIM